MSWTSNNAQPNKEVVHTHHPLPVYAIMAHGLGLGMLFSHALHFASISSGATPYLQSWILLLMATGLGLGYFGNFQAWERLLDPSLCKLRCFGNA